MFLFCMLGPSEQFTASIQLVLSLVLVNYDSVDYSILPNLGAQESAQLEQFPCLQVKLISSWAHQFANLRLSDF